ncbi:FAD-dependent oxidoreductase [Parasphaerochaeta coccoides]|uniref:Fumarate reductase/succinate dehydrogenase flavoprotein domain protein n=1 Tax=Parasphaerochaeta coccoides (strain ATCC BAA-1237 / DSM 17374 / SPN1) TaxID=760011 RepID=F4GJM7_PARC1|nr:FAD-binding protein [Parasphaerochaeta coccoides]AEC02774.1 fumarate reductase/succinate dehydrogenase flavoprotein domain protein [Parasphaerochaeta coccoides DSM 17374]
MKNETVSINEHEVSLYSCNTIVVGSGAAGFNAASRLFDYGVKDCAIVTEKQTGGTSRNTGSDKQTYYKVSLSGNDADSVYSMAETLFSGGSMDGDIALCEAASSSESFMRLVQLGVPFPRNRYGEFIGYKTDHDPYRRATSVGPYTSRMMTERLEAEVMSKGIPIFDGHQVIRVLTHDNEVRGLLCLVQSGNEEPQYVVFNCRNVVYATGGPAAMYAESVFPGVQFGASGLAFEAGVKGKNLTEWQYGLASVRPRWNVSGTYMQAMPRFISTDSAGKDEKEFLLDFFPSREEMLSRVFLKGYQWPFDARKVSGQSSQSSIVDILVYLEKQKGRRVFLDYRSNPGSGAIDFSVLEPEARDYMEKAGACFGTPFERLSHMNRPAVDFYRTHGIDLALSPLEISLCAQHNNGGLATDLWWQTNIAGFFAVGEVAGTHGVYRPGGAALNAGQAGSQRAALFISAHRTETPREAAEVVSACTGAISEMIELGRKAVKKTEPETARTILHSQALEMSAAAGPFRTKSKLEVFRTLIEKKLAAFPHEVHVTHPSYLAWVFRLRDVLISQFTYVSAMIDYVDTGGKSRGSALYADSAGEIPYPGLSEGFRFIIDDGFRQGDVQEISYGLPSCSIHWRTVRPIPHDDSFFENVWRMYRENQNIW